MEKRYNTLDILRYTKTDVYRNSKDSKYIWYSCSLYDFFTSKMRTKKNRDTIDFLRELNKRDEKCAKKYKADNLPGCTVSCLCDKRRLTKKVIYNTGIISIDIDAADNQGMDPEKVKADIIKLPYVMLTMKSCRGDGVFCLVKYNRENDFVETFNALKEDFKNIGYIIDKKCYDIVRLRLITYDENMLINGIVTEYDKVIKKPDVVKANRRKYEENGIWELTKDDLKSISTIIYVLVNYCDYTADEYDEWLYEGFRLATIPNYELGLKLFTMISRNSEGYEDDEDVKAKFDECRRTTNNNTNVLGYYVNVIKDVYGPEWKSVVNELLKKHR